MKLKEFIEKFVEKNTLVRLWYKEKSGHRQVIESDKPKMEWDLARGEFKDREVIGVTDILVTGHYSEAVNIVIKKTK